MKKRHFKFSRYKKEMVLIMIAIIVVGLATAVAISHHKKPPIGTLPMPTSPQPSAPSPAPKGTGTGSPGTGSAAGTPSPSPTPQASPPSPTPTTPTVGPYSSSPSLPVPSYLALNKTSISLSSNNPQTSPDGMNVAYQTVAEADASVRFIGQAGEIKSLPAKKSDGGGGANFDWSATAVGLTTGKWKVEAVVTKDGQVAISAPISLDVQP